MCGGEDLQQLRCLREPQFVGAIAEDFGQVAFRYDAVGAIEPVSAGPAGMGGEGIGSFLNKKTPKQCTNRYFVQFSSAENGRESGK